MHTVYDRRDLTKMREMEKYVSIHPFDMDKIFIRLEDDIIVRTTRARALLNTYLFEVYEDHDLDISIRRKYIYKSQFKKGALKTFMNTVIDDIIDKMESPEIWIGDLLGDIVSCFHRLSMICNESVSLDHSLIGYIDAYRRDEGFRSIIDNPVINKGDDPYEVEEKYSIIYDTVKKCDISPLTQMLDSGVKCNNKQLMAMVQIGLQPDYLDPARVKNITTTGMINGYDNIEDMFHMDMQALEAVIKGKNEVQEPGGLSKLIGVALSDTKLNTTIGRKTIHDCGTKDVLKAKIKNEKDLLFFRFKYFVDEDGKILGYIDENRQDLIGKTLNIRNVGMCKSEDCVCEVCTGHQYRFFEDTPVFKSNLYEYSMDKIGEIFQKVISIKHSNSADIKIMPCKYDGVEYKNITDFMKDRKDLVERLSFNRLIFKPNVKLELVSSQNTYDDLIVNGILLELPDEDKTLINDHEVEIYIPNDSVLCKAGDLNIMLKGHSVNSTKPSERFDRKGFPNMTRAEKVSSFYWYCVNKIGLPHSLYYETIVHAMIRDENNLSKRPSETCNDVTFIHASNVLSSKSVVNNVSSKIHHGYVSRHINNIILDTKPTEADILYNIIRDRKSTERIVITELYNILTGLRQYNTEED